MTLTDLRQMLQVPRCVEFICFKAGVPIKFREQVGVLPDKRAIILEKDKMGNVVGIQLL
jgi:hypothetical protein